MASMLTLRSLAHDMPYKNESSREEITAWLSEHAPDRLANLPVTIHTTQGALDKVKAAYATWKAAGHDTAEERGAAIDLTLAVRTMLGLEKD